jgi:hypothetical protein
MPRRGHAWFDARREDPVICRERRQRRRLQEQLHKAERRQRELRAGENPQRWQTRHAAIAQLVREKTAESGVK